MDRVSYVDIHNGLEEADAWLRTIGLDQNDRLRQSKRNLAMMAEAAAQGTLGDLIADRSGVQRRELMWSLLESTEFIDAVDALRKGRCEIPPQVLEAALEGPVDLHLESPRSNRGRNIMFEIALAGKLAVAGLAPVLGDEPDIRVELNDRNIFIQCKRVFSRNGLRGCFRDANRQLKRDLGQSCDPRDCGLIAISISRVCNDGDKILVVPSEDVLRQMLIDEIDSVRKEMADTYRDVNAPKIAGVLFHLSTPAFRADIKLYVAAYSVTIDHIPGKSDRALLKTLSELI
jgi:hypothetical protein